MANWKGQSRGTPLGYRIFIFLIKYAGIRSAYFLLYFVSFYFVFAGSKKTQNFYFRKIHQQNSWRSFWSRLRNNYRFGQVLIDKVAALSGNASQFTFDFDGENYLREMKEGGFMIGAHMGNWEIAGELLKRLDVKVNILMYENERQQIKQLLDDVQSEKTMNIIPLKEDLSHIVAIKQAMERNEIVVIHGDRFVEGAPSIKKIFMGKEAQFPYGPFYLAARFNKPISFAFAFKETALHYHFYATPLKIYPRIKNLNDRKEVSGMILYDYIEILEKMVQKYPEQWFNFYEFWEEEKNEQA